jgi:hypothetical protein
MTRFIAILLLAIALIVGGYFAYGKSATPEIDTTSDELPQPASDAPQGKLMSVEAYVSQNISALSPIKETMGGTFYVTEIEVEPEERKGHVRYEDGHNAYEADFTYTSDDRAGHGITSFVVRN